MLLYYCLYGYPKAFFKHFFRKTGGGPDVDVMSITGEQEVITRKQLMDNYVHCNGKRINVKFLVIYAFRYHHHAMY